jgi:hypothetical protein
MYFTNSTYKLRAIFSSTRINTSKTDRNKKITVGSEQSLKVRMSGADVINALGSPNIITSDATPGRETWVYKKISKKFEVMPSASNSEVLRSC